MIVTLWSGPSITNVAEVKVILAGPFSDDEISNAIQICDTGGNSLEFLAASQPIVADKFYKLTGWRAFDNISCTITVVIVNFPDQNYVGPLGWVRIRSGMVQDIALEENEYNCQYLSWWGGTQQQQKFSDSLYWNNYDVGIGSSDVMQENGATTRE